MFQILALFSYPNLTATIAFFFSCLFVLILFYDFRSMGFSFWKFARFLMIIFFSFFVCLGLLNLFYVMLIRLLSTPLSHMLSTTFSLAVYALFCGYFLSCETIHNKLCMGTVFVFISQPFYFALNGLLSRLVFPEHSFHFNDILTLCLYPVLLLLIVLFLRRFSIRDLRKVPFSFWISVILITLTCFILTVSFYDKVIFRNDMYSLIVALIFISILCDLSTYYFSYSLCKEYIRNLDLTKLNLKAEDDYKIMECYDQLYEKIRTMRHELKNHIALMRIMTQQKDYEGLEHYLSELCEKSYPILHTIDCKNPVIRMIVNNMSSMASMENIQLSTFVSVPEVLPISDTDLCSLLSNLIVNAYEAAVLSPDSRITLSIKVENDFLFVHIENSIRESVLATNPQFITSKNCPWEHGLGIKTIKSIAAKYNGNVIFSEQNQMFIVKVMLVLPAQT